MMRPTGAGSGFFQPMTLDVDEKILDKNLKIVSDAADDEFGSIFPGMSSKPVEKVSLLPEPDYPSVQVGYHGATRNVLLGQVLLSESPNGKSPTVGKTQKSS